MGEVGFRGQAEEVVAFRRGEAQVGGREGAGLLGEGGRGGERGEVRSRDAVVGFTFLNILFGGVLIRYLETHAHHISHSTSRVEHVL